MSAAPVVEDWGKDLVLEVVICTYNNVALLSRVLDHLAAQRVVEDAPWGVVVIDNNCTDGTAEEVSRHVADGRIPHLRRVVEPKQGLTHARLRGITETTADWVAFVDDDCLLNPYWIAAAAEFIRTNPACGGFGGQVELQWEVAPPPGLDDYGALFAEQLWGDDPRELVVLVGAGMVLSRVALQASGWMEQPLLTDRVGRRLSTCGDTEIALRVRSAGYALRYAPRLHLHHVMPERRTEQEHLLPLSYELGVGALFMRALTAPAGGSAWLRAVVSRALWLSAWGLRRSLSVVAGRRTRLCARIDRRFAAGAWAGIWRLARMGRHRRRDLVAAAHGIEDIRWRL